MPRLSVFMIHAALLHLGIGFTFGALMLSNKGLNFEPQVWRLLNPHIEILVFGWMIQLAMGVAFWALPRFTAVERYGKEWLGWWCFVLFNGGVLMTAYGRWIGTAMSGFALSGRLAVLLAVVSFTVMIWSRVKPLGGFAAEQNKGQGAEAALSARI